MYEVIDDPTTTTDESVCLLLECQEQGEMTARVVDFLPIPSEWDDVLYVARKVLAGEIAGDPLLYLLEVADRTSDLTGPDTGVTEPELYLAMELWFRLRRWTEYEGGPQRMYRAG